ncbi:SHOCT domain-containing protein [Streptomyces sp. RerS4]|uniref:SHOCT domain-containing protein n=1 Tax=Streptomyces sp. RerS4 TaxID=2942449 RepID=UPI0032E36117
MERSRHGRLGLVRNSLTTLIVWALIIAAAALVIRALRRDATDGRTALAPPTASAKGAETLLADRYARGEIDDEEYTRRLAVLRSHAPGTTSP